VGDNGIEAVRECVSSSISIGLSYRANRQTCVLDEVDAFDLRIRGLRSRSGMGINGRFDKLSCSCRGLKVAGYTHFLSRVYAGFG